VDLVEAFALPVPSLVICTLLGVPYADHDFFQRNSRILLAVHEQADRALAAQDELLEYLDWLAGQKLDHPADDLLSSVAVRRVGTGELTREDMARMGMLLLVAGHETTANMIALGTAVLLANPVQFAALRDTGGPAVIGSAVEELLRFLTITQSGRRRVTLADIEVDGQVIGAGEGMVLAHNVGNRDGATFPDPDRLDVHRDARRHLAFGFGVHQCLGQPLARMELQVVYGTLYRRIPSMRLATPVTDLPFKHDGLIYGIDELPIAW
jgi:cytochrome P450